MSAVSNYQYLIDDLSDLSVLMNLYFLIHAYSDLIVQAPYTLITECAWSTESSVLQPVDYDKHVQYATFTTNIGPSHILFIGVF